MDLYSSLCTITKEENILRDEPMCRHTTFRVGGPADYFVTPQSVEEIRGILAVCRKENVPYYIVGNGSNLLVGDGGFRGVVLQIFKKMNDVRVEGERVTAQAGVLLSKVASAAYNASLTGLEFAAGIPGTLGGAVRMNAGAYGGEMKQVLESAVVLTQEGELLTIPVEELGLAYRTSVVEKKDYVVVEATLRLKKGDQAAIREVMDDLKQRRVTKQPLEFGSAGSTFKRPEGYFAGKLIEDAGLLNRLCRKFALMTSPFVIVHGGGTFAGQLAERLGIPRKMIDGRRVTDRETLEVTVMVYAGWVNKTLVARLQALGVNACGLSGCDLNLVQADRREGQNIDWGYVGDVRLVRTGRLELLLQAGVVPVISPITHDGKGVLLNSNADGIAAAVAETLGMCYDVELIYCFDKKGVLTDVGDEGFVIPCLTPSLYEKYKQSGMIHSGMIPKLDNAFKSVSNGVQAVRLIHPDDLDQPDAGTRIILEKQWTQVEQ